MNSRCHTNEEDLKQNTEFLSVNLKDVKVKVNFTLKQATKAHTGSRGRAPFIDLSAR
jgi:hypothetical protein